MKTNKLLQVNNQSRTAKVTRNMVFGLVFQVLNLLISFVSRTVFIRTLGAEYLGINGLFSNILTILSFAELGIGNAIVFSLYKPLAEKDQTKLASLMLLYKRAYVTIGTFVAVAGLCVIPFLNLIIKEQPDISENLSLLYILFLSNTAISYFFTYKKSIITADQKNYVVLTITEIVHIAQIIAQIVFLYITHNYILYLILQIAGTLITNIMSSIIADRMYPFLKEPAQPLDKGESKEIFKNVRALAVYKFGSVILNGTDNILVSMFDAIANVGLVSNYVLLYASCNTLLTKVNEAFTASVGNLNVAASKEKQLDIFNKMFFITAWLYGLASIGLLTVSKSLIITWIGAEYLLDDLTVFAIIIGFYVNGVHHAAYTYRTTLGYFVEGQASPIIAAILNLILSVLFYKWMGLCGIFFATPLARILSTGIVDPVLIYKRTFKKSPINYYLMYIGYFSLFVILYIACKYTVDAVSINGWIGVILKICIVFAEYNALMLLIFSKTQMFRDISKSFVTLVRKKVHHG